MPSLRTPLLLTTALALTAFARPADTLRFAVAAETKLTRTFESDLTAHTESLRTSLNGQPLPMDLTIHFEDREKIVVVDEVQKAGAGRPAKLARRYQELSGTSTQRITGSGDETDDEPMEREKESPLEGKTVVFTWDAEEEEYRAEYGEDAGDDDLLAGLYEDMDLRRFLPMKDVEEGATWELAAEAFAGLLAPGGSLRLTAPAEDGSTESDQVGEALRNDLRGTCKAKYAGTREVGGQRCGVIEFEAELESGDDIETEKGTLELTADMTVRGELLWNLAAGRMESLEAEVEMQVAMSMTNEVQVGGGSGTIEQSMELAGVYHLQGRVEG